MVFKANCDVHYFNCGSILFKDYFLPALTGELLAPVSFSPVTFSSPPPLSVVLCPP